LNPLGIFAGSASALDLNGGGSNLSLFADPVNGGSPILAGLGLPYDPPEVEFGFTASGVNASEVIARWGSPTGNPAILARTGVAVPGPATLVLLGGGLLAVARVRSRRRK
jgi:hypothetical protein